jgi:hypothetical protein
MPASFLPSIVNESNGSKLSNKGISSPQGMSKKYSGFGDSGPMTPVAHKSK